MGCMKKDARSAEKSVRSRSTYIGEQGCAASGEPMFWHENSSILKERMVMTYLRKTKCIKLFAWPRYYFGGLDLLNYDGSILLMNGGAAGAY